MDNGNLKILIVEDEFFISLDLEEQAKSLGHTVVGTAATADEAIRMAGETRPDIVLMDIRLAGAADGITAALAIRSQYGIESVFATANTDPHTLARAKAIKPLGVLEKPITLERLRAQLTSVARHTID
ncbi:response regulator [Bradyrhizobium sp. PMVTL-01]|uniref:response regulator n=1 Tax=Bradyrhizobium sp. PMVTL-01 TaxID=3434999 RepID=UPI003F72C1EC